MPDQRTHNSEQRMQLAQHADRFVHSFRLPERDFVEFILSNRGTYATECIQGWIYKPMVYVPGGRIPDDRP